MVNRIFQVDISKWDGKEPEGEWVEAPPDGIVSAQLPSHYSDGDRLITSTAEYIWKSNGWVKIADVTLPEDTRG